jgi:site-specific recombinase XerD
VRDVALLWVLFSAAAKPIEIARLAVRDYLFPEGAVREESELPAAVAVNGHARPLSFRSALTRAAVNAYLEERIVRGWGVAPGSPAFRGLAPDSRLFLTDKGEPMPLRVRKEGCGRHVRCHSILEIYRRLFASAGIEGVTVFSARRTVAHALLQEGADLREIGTVLGLKHREAVRNVVRHLGVSPSAVAGNPE